MQKLFLTRSFIVLLLVAGQAVDVPSQLGSATQVPQKRADTSQHEPIEIHGASAERETEILRDIALFESAGLDLPRLQIHVHDSVDGCDGWRGMFNADGSGHRIDLCGDVLLHELAHAWEHHSVEDATRSEFLEFANLDVWYDASVPHPTRGVEHAANTIAWGVGTSEEGIGQVRPHTNLAERYELLTGLVSRRVAGSASGPTGRETSDATVASNTHCGRMCD